MSLTLMLGLGAASASGLGLGRGLVARWVVARVRRRAVASIAALEQRNTHVTALPRPFAASAAQLLETLSAARATQAAIIARMQRTVAELPGGQALLPEIEHSLQVVGVSFMESMRASYLLKFRHLAATQIADRFDDSYQIMRHARHGLSAAEQNVIDLFDEIGVIDFAEQSLELVPEAVRLFSDSVAEAAANGVSDLMRNVEAIVNIPGFIGGARDAIQEIKYLMEDDISLGDALSHGGLPSITRLIMTKIGIALDTATGWASLGAFTVVFSWLGSVLGQEILKGKLQAQLDIVNQHLGVIRQRERAALAAINDASNASIAAFSAAVERCPAIGDEPVLAAFVDRLHRGYTAGLAEAVAATARDLRSTLDGLPARTWLDRLLSIDRSAEVAALYREAQRRVDTRLVGVMHGFSLAAETDAEEALKFIRDRVVFENAATCDALDQLEQTVADTAEAYAASLTAWELRCQAVWTEGMQRVEAVTKSQHAATRAVVKREQAAMEPVQRKINMLRKRLKLEPA